MLVVWEPILSGDWRPPGRSALARIPDGRARQFWDPEHRIAQEIARRAAATGKSPPACCLDNGFLWDEALLFAPGSSWTSAPTPLLWDGPVYKVVPGLESALHSLSASAPEAR